MAYMTSALFISIDGVLSSKAFNPQNSPQPWPLAVIDPAAVARLNSITTATNVELVITAPWRMIFQYEKLIIAMRRVGLTGTIRGITERLGTHRAVEIQRYLDKNPAITKYVILDTDTDMDQLTHGLVTTSGDTGLLDEHVDRVLQLLR